MKSFNEEWEEIHASQEWGKYPSEHVIRFVARNYYKEQRDKVKILDFGCGAGSNTWYLAREGFDTYAFDGSRSAIKRLEDRLKSDRLFADLRVRDACNLDYTVKFDCIIDNVAIYANTLENIEVMYKNCYNMLKKDGKLFTVAFLKETTGYGTGEKLEDATYKNIEEGCLSGRGTARFWDRGEVSEILKGIGFANVIEEKNIYTDNGNIVAQCMIQASKNE